jgi:hypothetical protein
MTGKGFGRDCGGREQRQDFGGGFALPVENGVFGVCLGKFDEILLLFVLLLLEFKEG